MNSHNWSNPQRKTAKPGVRDGAPNGSEVPPICISIPMQLYIRKASENLVGVK